MLVGLGSGAAVCEGTGGAPYMDTAVGIDVWDGGGATIAWPASEAAGGGTGSGATACPASVGSQLGGPP